MVKMIFARRGGEWLDIPALEMAGASGTKVVYPTKQELVPLPEGATLVMMPTAAPIGFRKETGEFLSLEEDPYEEGGGEVWAMAALLPQGFTRTLVPATLPARDPLPLLGYTAVGIEKGRLMVAAIATDEHKRWHPQHYNTQQLEGLIAKRMAEMPQNRILRQLAHCSLEYGCFTAQNIFYRRWEGGIPVSPCCNANCIGCISLQPSECCPSPQQRIDFVPTAREVAEMGIAHLKEANSGIISFGQGCEGEPSLQWPVICEAIKMIRAQTAKGSININTNAGDSEAIAKIIEAGIDSLRVSLFSPIEEEYAAYHRPLFPPSNVKVSLLLAKEAGIPVSLNLLTYPGFTDSPHRYCELVKLVKETQVRQIQLRNLNIDPQIMEPFCQGERGMGIAAMLRSLEQDFPDVKIGNYSRIWR